MSFWNSRAELREMAESKFRSIWVLKSASQTLPYMLSSSIQFKSSPKHKSSYNINTRENYKLSGFLLTQNFWIVVDIKLKYKYILFFLKLYIPVKIVEEWEEVECKFAPAFLLTVCQNICIHYCSGVIQSRSTHHRAAHIPAHKQTLDVALWARTMLTNHLLTSEKLAGHICWGVWYIANKYEMCVSLRFI